MDEDSGDGYSGQERPCHTPGGLAAPPPQSANDNGPPDQARYAARWGFFAHQRLDLIENRIAKLEQHPRHHPHLRLASGGAENGDDEIADLKRPLIKDEITDIRRELALTDIYCAVFFGVPFDIEKLPKDLWGLR